MVGHIIQDAMLAVLIGTFTGIIIQSGKKTEVRKQYHFAKTVILNFTSMQITEYFLQTYNYDKHR